MWIWTDVDGIMTTDPKIVQSAKMLPQLSYGEAAEMAIFGAKAMHPSALEPVIEAHIPVRIRNVFNPENHGTLIADGQETKSTEVVKAVALIKDVAMINIRGAAMVGAPGSYSKVFDVLGKNNINIMMISAAVSEANISLIIRRNLLGRALSTLEIALLGRGLVSEMTAEDDVCVIAVMGANMKGTLGVASRIFTTMAQQGNKHPHDRPRIFGTKHFLRGQGERWRSSSPSNSRRIQTRQNVAYACWFPFFSFLLCSSASFKRVSL